MANEASIAAAIAAAETAKDKGNADFASGHYLGAISFYGTGVSSLEEVIPSRAMATAAIAAAPAQADKSGVDSDAVSAATAAARASLPEPLRRLLVALLCNRAFASLKVELYGSAQVDATVALAWDPACVKAYYRRGSAQLALAHYAGARADFRAVLRLRPGDADATAKLDAVQKAAKRAAFEAAIATEPTRPLAERLDVDSLVVDSSYSGPVLPPLPPAGTGASSADCAADANAVNEHGISAAFVRALVSDFRAQRVLHRKYALQLLLRFKRLLDSLPSLVRVPFPAGSTVFNVAGDTHGQFYDTLNIFDLAGPPSPSNPYLFNGDFVDRGSFSVENVLTLFAYKLLYPEAMHLTRGNHETQNMNKMYGFEGEVKVRMRECSLA